MQMHQGSYNMPIHDEGAGLDQTSFNNSLNYIFYELDKISTVRLSF